MPRTAPAPFETIADVLDRLGGVAPERVRFQPTPGTATERYLIRLQGRTDRLYELVEGTLVEKVMGYPESSLTMHLSRLLGNFIDAHKLGNLAGPDGTMRLMPGLVRGPDISFVSRDRFPNRQAPLTPIAGFGPDLAVEVLSPSNTEGEMQRKLKEYFLSGARLVWFVDPRKLTVEVFTAPDQSVLLTEDHLLGGGDVLPGLSLPVREVFVNVPRPVPKPARGKGRKPANGKSKP